jgi:hypothetical protein
MVLMVTDVVPLPLMLFAAIVNVDELSGGSLADPDKTPVVGSSMIPVGRLPAVIDQLVEAPPVLVGVIGPKGAPWGVEYGVPAYEMTGTGGRMSTPRSVLEAPPGPDA